MGSALSESQPGLTFKSKCVEQPARGIGRQRKVSQQFVPVIARLVEQQKIGVAPAY